MKRNPITYILFGIVVVVVLYFSICMLIGMGFFRVFTFHSRLNNLLYKTDHHTLLAGCRTLIDEGYQGQYICQWAGRDPNVDEFPEVILELKPTYVWIHDDGCLEIEMLGGMSHYGVKAYAEDFNEPYENYRYGDRKLIDGLWFYSDFVDISKVDLEKKRQIKTEGKGED